MALSACSSQLTRHTPNLVRQSSILRDIGLFEKILVSFVVFSKPPPQILWTWLPPRYSNYDGVLVYQSSKHGTSPTVLYARSNDLCVDRHFTPSIVLPSSSSGASFSLADSLRAGPPVKPPPPCPCLTLIRDTRGSVFGCFNEFPWVLTGATFYGNGQSFVFSLEPHGHRYGWDTTLQPKPNIMWMRTSREGLSMGGGGPSQAILLGPGDLSLGHSGCCETFANLPLVAGAGRHLAPLVASVPFQGADGAGVQLPGTPAPAPVDPAPAAVAKPTPPPPRPAGTDEAAPPPAASATSTAPAPATPAPAAPAPAAPAPAAPAPAAPAPAAPAPAAPAPAAPAPAAPAPATPAPAAPIPATSTAPPPAAAPAPTLVPPPPSATPTLPPAVEFRVACIEVFRLVDEHYLDEVRATVEKYEAEEALGVKQSTIEMLEGGDVIG
ncbi:hypothetical protein PAPYR_4056 [Paratrimastix pyriformis]|uniref:TLDc domain-containing protein n=1 Tax=Paratrimastix pyriformis TaxID=342808 RepID=A0ABQ8UNV9_9EUKA|nr:hypothetical protein PAPYR_4056 [Paratrimastix pyriformis]